MGELFVESKLVGILRVELILVLVTVSLKHLKSMLTLI